MDDQRSIDRFNKYQLNINIKTLPFLLYEVRRYQNNVLSLHRIEGPKGITESLPVGELDTEIDEVDKEVQVITEEEHISRGSESIQKLYTDFREQILDLDEFHINPRRPYIGYWYSSKMLYVLKIQRERLMFFIHKRNLDDLVLFDPDKKFKDADSGKSWSMNIIDIDSYEYAVNTLKDHFRKYLRSLREV